MLRGESLGSIFPCSLVRTSKSRAGGFRFRSLGFGGWVSWGGCRVARLRSEGLLQLGQGFLSYVV